MVKLTIKSKSGPTLEIQFVNKTTGQVTVEELKVAIAAKLPKLKPVRQRLTLPSSPSSATNTNANAAKSSTKLNSSSSTPTVLSNNTATLDSYGVPYQGGEIFLKDLGPQAGWRDVYVLEYLGPLFIHPLLFLASTKYGYNLNLLASKLGFSIGPVGSFKPSSLQQLVFGLIMFHFIKREYETVFVHRFSNATMPLRNLPKNCLHYWGLAGLLLGASLYRPAYGELALKDSLLSQGWWLAGWTGVIMFGQISNYITHLNLRSIRTPAGQPRKYPRGYGFNLITCANYFFEIVVWSGLSLMTMDPAFFLFAAIGAGQMAVWADKKHRTYRKEHGDKYPRGRYRMIPFLF